MALSKNAARTLEQVKSGLSILYGADYFTEDEWIKLDGLIHKGNYVFTRGPQANILDEELMSFDDFEDTILSTPTPTPAQKELAPVPEPERRLPTPISENPSLNFSEPTQNEFSGSLPNDTSADTSAEASADEGSANVVPTSAEKVPEPPAAPASTPASAPAPANGGLVWYTQAQLDEVKAFNANLTKAGQKGGAKKGKDVFRHTSSASRSFHSPQSNYGSVEQDVNSRAPAWDTVEQTSTPQQPAWGNVEKGFVPEKPAWETASENPQAQIDDGFPSMAPDDISSVNQTFPTSAWPQGEQNDGNPSPTSVEQENRINSWADEVMDTAPVSVYESLVQEPLKSRFANGTDNFPQVIEKFIQVHGKQPRSTNDVFQPRNPEFKGPKRPDSRASVRTATRPVVPSKTRALHATNGSIFLAHANSPKRSNIAIEVKAGDSIRYIKYVSGIMHTGLNLRTNQQGQFPETVLEPIQSQVSLLQQQRAAAQNAFRDRGNTFTSALSHGLDRVESTNAAEWEKESEASRPTTSTTEAVAPMPLRTNAGLAGPRFAALAETESQDGGSERAGSLTQAEIRKIIREELAHKSPAAMHQRSRTVAQPEHVLTNIVPKTTTCWYWKNKNDCRFTAEECIHLHADLPDGGESTNLRFGKPTWAALADATISPPSTTITRNTVSDGNAAIEFKRFSKSKTCYYWATDGKCNNSEVDCKYLHEYTAAGVAHKPGNYVSHKKDFNWSRVGRNGMATEHPTSPPAQTLHAKEYGWGASEGGMNHVADVLVNTWDEPSESSAALMANPNAAIWGAVEGSSAWDVDGGVYKPPHIKALEERERIEAVGW